IHYGPGPAPSFLDLPDEFLERVIVIYGVSKAYAMTGWRIGLALAPAKVAKAMAALQSHTTTGANHPAQWAAAAALGDERVEQDAGCEMGRRANASRISHPASRYSFAPRWLKTSTPVSVIRQSSSIRTPNFPSW